MHAKIRLLLGVVVTLFGVQGCSQASSQEVALPNLKAGLWETTHVHRSSFNRTAKTANFQVTDKSCIGNETSAIVRNNLLSRVHVLEGVTCKKTQTVSGSTTTLDAACPDGTKYRLTTTLKGNTSIHQELRMFHQDLHMLAGVNETTISDARWVSSTCPPGLKPGDFQTSDGHSGSYAPDGQLIQRN